MTTRMRMLIAAAALLLVPTYWLPLWSIRIVAPQYNDGLGMFIGLTDIWGHTQHDIQNINILNHYIGMKPIDPETVDVLTVMPWVVAFLMAAALVAALVGKRALIAAWLVAFAILGSAGLYEFWRWNHDYGHNLDPMAPIKVPGMTYQPPLIGTRQLLNMTTSSFPTWGTLFIALSFASGITALVLAHRARPAVNERWSAGSLRAAAAVMVAALASACGGTGPRPIHVGEEECEHCRMVISDERFAAQLLTRHGKALSFDAAECMAGYVNGRKTVEADIHSLWVLDASDADRWLPAEEAVFLRSPQVRSPMGAGLIAYSDADAAHRARDELGGELLHWREVLIAVRGNEPRRDHGHH
jgi:copper chaperone NosL